MEDMAVAHTTYLPFSMAHLSRFSSKLCQQMIAYPREVIPAIDTAAQELFLRRHRSTPGLHDLIAVAPLQTRPFDCPQSRTLRQLTPADLDQLVLVQGLVTRLSSPLPEMIRAVFVCQVCGQLAQCQVDQGSVAEPPACLHCHSAHTYVLLHNRSRYVDKQLVRLQESPEDMPAGGTPDTVLLCCHDDLVDAVQAGDRVQATAIYRAVPARQRAKQRTLQASYRTYLDVLHFKADHEHGELRSGDATAATSATMTTTTTATTGGNTAGETAAASNLSSISGLTPPQIDRVIALSNTPDVYERLAAAIAPEIYEHEDIKKGILLQLLGGRRKTIGATGQQLEVGGANRDNEFRSDVNILLCGDPGTSKSQLLQYACRLVARSQYTSGKGSSAVGLTAYVTKDAETGESTLQSGALVLADSGICCIDEFDKMSEQTRSTLHEVMEQQTLSMAKHGIVCVLRARTSVLAAANPVGSKWDAHRTILENIRLPHSLLSRFDLIFLMLDTQQEQYDARLARHLVRLYRKEGGRRRRRSGVSAAISAAVSAAAADGDDGEECGDDGDADDDDDDVMDVDQERAGRGGERDKKNNKEDAESSSKIVEPEVLRDYIRYAKSCVQPCLTEEAAHFLVQEYVQMRQLHAGGGASAGTQHYHGGGGGGSRGQISAYPRQLESLIRLSEAHARMRLCARVELEDCREARRLQREALKQSATDPSSGHIDVSILTSGLSSVTRRRAKELGEAVWQLMEPKRLANFSASALLEELRRNCSNRMITRDAFEDALNWLHIEGRLDWAGNTIRKRAH